MMMYPRILNAKREGKKVLVPLFDPDRVDLRLLPDIIKTLSAHKVDTVFVGGSHITTTQIEQTIDVIRHSNPDMCITLFPGSPAQVTPKTDSILFLSLVSGRNADLLISRQVEAAPILHHYLSENKKGTSGMHLSEIIPTAYMLIDGGNITTAAYISGTIPIPRNKPDIAESTALASIYMGFKAIYMDTGSGALQTVPSEMIQGVHHKIKNMDDTFIIIGGGIDTPQKLNDVFSAGADIAVIGSIIEKDPSVIPVLCEVRDSLS